MQRRRTDGLVEALVTGQEQFVDEAVHSRSAAANGGRGEAARRAVRPAREVPVPAAASKTTARGELWAVLTSRRELRRAILLHDVLGPPKGLQP